MGSKNITVKQESIKPIEIRVENANQDQCSHAEAVIDLITSVAPDADIVLYPVLGANGLGRLSDLIKALDASLVDRNLDRMHVINTSLGVGGDISHLSNRLHEPFTLSAVTIAAAGNLQKVENPPVSPEEPQFPARFSYTISVEAINAAGNLTSYTNLGGDTRAPGGDGDCNSQPHECLVVLSSRSNTGAMYSRGTSYSAAMITGLTARILQHQGQQSDATQLRSILP